MKKPAFIIAYTFLLISTSASATLNKEQCIRLLGAGIFNAYLEEYCEFNGGVHHKLLSIYHEAGCRKIIPQKTVEKTTADVVKDSMMREKAHGHYKFCSDNMEAYNRLQDN